MNTFKLPGQQIPQPPLQQRSDPPHEEQPDSPARSPEATTWTLAHRPLSKKKERNKKNCMDTEQNIFSTQAVGR